MYYTKISSPLCEIILAGDERGLSHLHLNTGEGKRRFEILEDWIENHEFFAPVIQQIEEYFQGKRTSFDLLLNPQGTEFQKKVWNALADIPYAQVRSYQDIAMQVGSPKGYRAVGAANGKNPIPLIIPCHRVVGKNGALTGFAHGLGAKEGLLNHERIQTLYHELYSYYGPQHWWPAESSFEMMVGAILTQNTAWTNVEKAIERFGEALSPTLIRDLAVEELAEIIRPSGYHNQKAEKLKNLVKWMERYGDEIDRIRQKSGGDLRGELLSLNGIGKETADCILTYALEKPSFVIDAYARRLFERLGFEVPPKYDDFRSMIERALDKELTVFNEFHALIVEHCKTLCLKKPKCEECPIKYCMFRMRALS